MLWFSFCWGSFSSSRGRALSSAGSGTAQRAEQTDPEVLVKLALGDALVLL